MQDLERNLFYNQRTLYLTTTRKHLIPNSIPNANKRGSNGYNF